MADTLRIKSNLPIGFTASEPHPDPDHPGNSPALKSIIIRPGVNELNEADAKVYKAWASAAGSGFVASSDDVKNGDTTGKVYEMTEDEPETEYGFEPALKRATQGDNASAAGDGSTLKDKGPVKAEDMKTGSADASNAAVLTAGAPLKVPATTDVSGKAPAPVTVTK